MQEQLGGPVCCIGVGDIESPEVRLEGSVEVQSQRNLSARLGALDFIFKVPGRQ